KLVDAKGRKIPTVRAVAISQREEDSQITNAENDENLVLAELLREPDTSIAGIAEHYGWRFDNGEVAKSRVQRAIERVMRHAKPALLRKNRNKWELTEEGIKIGRVVGIKLHQEVMEAQNANEPYLNF